MLVGALGARAGYAQPALEAPYYLLEACTYPDSERPPASLPILRAADGVKGPDAIAALKRLGIDDPNSGFSDTAPDLHRLTNSAWLD